MGARDYLSLLADGAAVIRTLRHVHGNPSPETAYVPGQTRAVVDGIHPSRVRVRVKGVRSETASTITLVVEPIDGRLPPCSPGQYVNVFVEVSGVKTSRPMSISGLRGQNALELTIKRKQGGFVSHHLVDQVQVGDELLLSGPQGDFYFMPVRDGDDLVFLAAGSGITPFMGMVEQIVERFPDVKLGLLYGSRSADDIIFRERLQNLADGHSQLRLRFVVSRPDESWPGERGRIDKEMARRFIGGESLEAKTFFICGPRQMERDLLRGLQELGVGRGRVRLESSGARDDAARLPGWPAALDPSQMFQIQIEGREQPIVARAGEPLLSSLERAGVTLTALCRSGVCGCCRTRLRSGRVVRSTSPGQRSSDREAGLILACMCHPVSDLQIAVSEDHHGVMDRQVLGRDSDPKHG